MQVSLHRCRRTTAVAQLPAHNTTWKAITYKPFLKNVSKDIIILFYSFSN